MSPVEQLLLRGFVVCSGTCSVLEETWNTAEYNIVCHCGGWNLAAGCMEEQNDERKKNALAISPPVVTPQRTVNIDCLI